MISVIIPTHNRRELLDRAIQSVLRQSVRDFEIIVVSDGSTDDTEAYLHRLKQAEEKLTFYSYHEAKGANYARNLGILHAAGEYIAFLDDDDEWFPDKLLLQQKRMEESPDVGLVYTHIDVVDRNSDRLWTNRCMVEGDASKTTLFGGFIFTTSCVMLRKDVIINAGLFDETLPAMQDVDMWIRCCQITKVAVVPVVLTRYYLYSSEGAGNSREQMGNCTQRYLDAAGILEKKYKDLYRGLTKKENRKRKGIIMAGMCSRAKRNHEKKLMRSCAGKAMIYSFSMKMLKIYLLSYMPGEWAFSFRGKLKKTLKGEKQ